MSRVGKKPITIPSGVKSRVDNGVIFVEGPKGKLEYKFASDVKVTEQGGNVTVTPIANDKQSNASHGSTRAIINNMVLGVTQGWKKSLELIGVGFAAKMQGHDLVLTCGYSHDVILPIPPIVKCTVQKTSIALESPDKNILGVFAARIRKTQPPEPYLGKGIKYTEETIRRKAGKTGKK